MKSKFLFNGYCTDIETFGGCEDIILYGAVTIGEVWRFGQLDREQQRITQDLELFKVPADLEQLVSVIVGIIQPTGRQ